MFLSARACFSASVLGVCLLLGNNRKLNETHTPAEVRRKTRTRLLIGSWRSFSLLAIENYLLSKDLLPMTVTVTGNFGDIETVLLSPKESE